MDKQQIAVKLIMDDLNVSFAMKEFNDRLVLQKAIYLAQEAGVDMGYPFCWYLKGPYSSQLAVDGFAISSELASGRNESENWVLPKPLKDALEKIRNFFTAEDLPKKLELLASVHFLAKKKNIGNPKNILKIFLNYGKPFRLPEIESALKELSKNGLLE